MNMNGSANISIFIIDIQPIHIFADTNFIISIKENEEV